MNRRVWVYDVTVILLGLTAVASLFWGYDPAKGMPTLLIFLFGLLLYRAISRGRSLRISWKSAAWVLVILCALVALVFLVQAVPPFIIRRVGALSALRYFTDGTEVQPAPGVPDLVVSLIKTAWRRNSVATGMEGALFLAVGLALTASRRRERRGALAAAALMSAAVGLSMSLGAWLAVLVAGLVWLAIYYRPARYLAFAGLLGMLVMVGMVLVSGDIHVLEQIPMASRVLGPMFIRPDRLQVYQNSVLLIQDFPLTGIGFGRQFGFSYSRYILLIPYEFLTNAHNLYLEIWLQQGLLGLAAFITLAAGILASARFRFEGVERLLFQATWVGLLATLVHGVSDSRQYDDPLVWLPFFVLLALNARLLLDGDPKIETSPRLARAAAVFAPAAGALFLAAALLLQAQSAPLPAVYWSNRGALDQQRAELNRTLSEELKEPLFQRARVSYARALASQPGNRAANYRLGLLALDGRNFPAAVAYLEKAYAGNPAHGGTCKALGLAYAFTGDLQAAKPLLENISSIVDELNYWGWAFLDGAKNTAGPVSADLKAAGINAYRLSYMLNPQQEDVKKFLEQEGY